MNATEGHRKSTGCLPHCAKRQSLSSTISEILLAVTLISSRLDIFQLIALKEVCNRCSNLQILLINSPPQSNLERVLCHPHWLQCDALHSLPKLPISLRRLPPSSNTPIPRPTPLITPNGIRIQSAFRHNTVSRQTDRQTDRWDRRQLYTESADSLIY